MNTSIDFTSFTQKILEILRKKLGADYTVFSHCVRKNNGMELTGIVAKYTGRTTYPTIYINSLYRDGITEEEIVEAADTLYEEFLASEFEKDVDLSDFVTFDKAKERLAFKLIHAEKNKELLKDVPHRLFHNLAIVFYYVVKEPPFYGKASILVRDSYKKRWGISTDELMELALKNTPALLPGVINDMEEVMREIIAENIKNDLKEESFFDEKLLEELISQMSEKPEKKKIPMYVLTNKQKLYGAACMLYPGVLKNFAEKMKQDFYILPSSVHEVILVPANAGTDQQSLREIVTDINRTQVAADEVLADSVYFYSRSRDKVLWLS